MLIDHYFKSGNIDTLSFGNSVLEDANIVTYGRAKNQKAIENNIQFSYLIEDFLIELIVTGDDDNTFAKVHTLTITNVTHKLSFHFNFQGRFIRITKKRSQEVSKAAKKFIADLEEQVAKTKKQLEDPYLKKTSKEYIELVSKLENFT